MMCDIVEAMERGHGHGNLQKNEERKRKDKKRNFIDYMLVFGGTTHVWSHTCVIVCVCDVWI